jgi:hypothetical protein
MKRRLKEIGSKYECDLMQVGNDIFAPAFDDNARLPSFNYYFFLDTSVRIAPYN